MEGFSAPMSVDIEENGQRRSHKPQPVFDRSKWTKHGPTGFIDIVNRGLTRDFADLLLVSLSAWLQRSISLSSPPRERGTDSPSSVRKKSDFVKKSRSDRLVHHRKADAEPTKAVKFGP